jgi:Ion channel
VKARIIYAGLYLLAIPAFAFVYSHWFQGSFYAPYAKLEQAAVDDAQAVLAAVDAAWHRQLPGDLAIPEDGFRLGFELRNPIILEDGRRLRFSISMVALYQPGLNPSLPKEGSTHIFPIDVYMDDRKIEVKKEDSFFSALKMSAVTANDLNQDGALVLRAIHRAAPETMTDLAKKSYEKLLLPNFFDFDRDRGLWLRPDEDRGLDALFKGYRGDPTAISLSFWRMAYFSTTAITTTGFGDIVPITPWARAVVAFESILGIILAGLFVNAVFNESKPAR